MISCQIPRKHRWAGAATPAQRNTTRPQEPPRRASDVINGTPMLGKHNPRWPIGNATETIRVPDVGPPGQRGPALLADALRDASSSLLAWLAGLPRRAGNRLFAINDEEARWRGWQVREQAGGLARQYRDPRFDTLGARFDPHGGRVESDPREPAESDPWLSGYIPGVPEAWDDHWDGLPQRGDESPQNPPAGWGS